jgi:hypothetical protein
MALSEFTSLLAVFLSGSLTNSASLTLTQAPDCRALPLFFREATKAAARAGIRLLEVEAPRNLLALSAKLAPGVIIKDSGDSNVVRFVYAPHVS